VCFSVASKVFDPGEGWHVMDNLIIESKREVQVIDSADVVVLGGGPAGVAAAVAAGRTGASVLLIERYGCLGGLATGGLVILLTSYGKRGEVLMSGLAVEVLQRLRARGAVRTPEWFKLENPVYDPEALKLIGLEMVEEAGVRLLLHSWAVGAQVEDNRVTAVVTESKSGRQAIRGRVFTDCTGDGDVAAWAGIPYEISQSKWGLGLDMRLGNVDYPEFRQFTLDNPGRWADLRGEMAKLGVEGSPLPAWRDDGTWFIASLPGDALSVRDLTRCEVTLRKALMKTHAFYRENVPGFEKATILDTASQVGTRESRRIIGEYTLSEEDVPGAVFRDSIGTGVTWTGPRAGEPFDFPYRCLLPKKVDNVLFAGRCLSATHEAHENTRVIPNCFVTGQAAGVAAALAVGDELPPRQISIKKLQQGLRDQGVEFGSTRVPRSAPQN
jgi:hypothetical protein